MAIPAQPLGHERGREWAASEDSSPGGEEEARGQQHEQRATKTLPLGFRRDAITPTSERGVAGALPPGSDSEATAPWHEETQSGSARSVEQEAHGPRREAAASGASSPFPEHETRAPQHEEARTSGHEAARAPQHDLPIASMPPGSDQEVRGPEQKRVAAEAGPPGHEKARASQDASGDRSPSVEHETSSPLHEEAGTPQHGHERSWHEEGRRPRQEEKRALRDEEARATQHDQPGTLRPATGSGHETLGPKRESVDAREPLRASEDVAGEEGEAAVQAIPAAHGKLGEERRPNHQQREPLIHEPMKAAVRDPPGFAAPLPFHLPDGPVLDTRPTQHSEQVGETHLKGLGPPARPGNRLAVEGSAHDAQPHPQANSGHMVIVVTCILLAISCILGVIAWQRDQVFTLDRALCRPRSHSIPNSTTAAAIASAARFAISGSQQPPMPTAQDMKQQRVRVLSKAEYLKMSLSGNGGRPMPSANEASS